LIVVIEIDPDFAFALKLAKEEEQRFTQQQEIEKRDAELARKLMQEDRTQQVRPATTRRSPAVHPTNNNRVTHPDPVAEQIARDEALAREKQNFYSAVPFTFFGGNTDPVAEQIARDEALAREKQSLYTAVPFSVKEQITNDETIARAKQNFYVEAFSVPQPRSQQHPQVQQPPQVQPQSQSQPQVPDLSASQLRRNFDSQLNSVADDIRDELSQMRLDEQMATDRQSVYTAQLGQMWRQIDRDEAVAKKLIKQQEDSERDGQRHQVSIHNMHCTCGVTTNMDHVWEIHDANCGCKTTMQIAIIPPTEIRVDSAEN